VHHRCQLVIDLLAPDHSEGERNGDAAIKLTDLKSGWGVVVDYDQSQEGHVALLVEVVDTP
jgi:hypothetical protein